MQDPTDYDLRPVEPASAQVPPGGSPPRGPWPWVIGLTAAAAVLLVIVFLVWPTAPDPRTAATPAPVADAAASPYETAAEPAGSLGAPADPVYLPPLGEADHVVRPLVSALSSHPRVLRLLATDDLIRRFTVSIENIAAGQTPAAHLTAIGPGGSYLFIDDEESVVADPRGFARYDDIANAFGSVDAQGAARLYTMLKPRLEEAYRELGHTTPFDRAMEQAIVSLLAVPAGAGNVVLEPKGALFRYADPSLETLTPAQKQLLRMGPRNVRLVQAKLREIGVALGIPDAQLTEGTRTPS